jgi:hypothetical protein
MAESVWKWTDEKGAVHYSDHPEGPNAVEVDVSTNTQTYSADEAKTGLPTPTSTSSSKAPKSNAAYQSLEIANPAADETFQNPEGPINAQVTLQPALKSGDTLQLLLDGQLVDSGSSTSFSLPDVERGTHVLQARIIGSNGATVMASSSVTFHVQKASTTAPARRRR